MPTFIIHYAYTSQIDGDEYTGTHTTTADTAADATKMAISVIKRTAKSYQIKKTKLVRSHGNA